MSGANKNEINKDMCRICCSVKKPLCPLFRYKLAGNYAEMLTSIADVKVSANDGLPDKICYKCCTSLERAYLIKNVAERTDKLLRAKLMKISANRPTKKIAFDSLTDIKSEITSLSVKTEPKWDVEIDYLATENGILSNTSSNLNDIVIANTVIRKVDSTAEIEDKKDDFFGDDKLDLDWKIKPKDDIDDGNIGNNGVKNSDFLDDDFFNDDDDADGDYVPPVKVKSKTKLKKKLSDLVVFKDNKPDITKFVMKKSDMMSLSDDKNPEGQLITCYPIMKNGCRGPPILLKRPKDATILKVHPNYKSRKSTSNSYVGRSLSVRDKPVKIARTRRDSQPKQKEKMVCPVCGILTYTLGNHMTTHQDRKRYTCAQCPRTFSQKGNLEAHLKQHSGIKDHICEVCGAGFYSQKSLQRHNLIHKGDRPYACNLCTKRFIARCDLNRHLRIHSGYKPYKCATCTMSFNAKHQLQNHERMHTGERPYTCEVCNVAFSYKVNLNNHVFKVHGINLKFKSIHNVTDDILQREQEMLGHARAALSHMLPSIDDVPTPVAHETVSHGGEHYV